MSAETLTENIRNIAQSTENASQAVCVLATEAEMTTMSMDQVNTKINSVNRAVAMASDKVHEVSRIMEKVRERSDSTVKTVGGISGAIRNMVVCMTRFEASASTIGDLIDQSDQDSERIKALTREIQQDSGEIATVVNHINAMFEEFASFSEETSSAVLEQSRVIHQIDLAVDDVTKAAADVTSQAIEMEVHAKEMEESAKDLRQSASEGAEETNQTAREAAVAARIANDALEERGRTIDAVLAAVIRAETAIGPAIQCINENKDSYRIIHQQVQNFIDHTDLIVERMSTPSVPTSNKLGG